MRYVLPPMILGVTLAGAVAAQTPAAPQLGLPIACTLGTNCFIQQYPDIQPGRGAKDYRCGIATYEEHSGTDFRVLSVKAAEGGVPVIASAAGRVRGVRDGVDDRLLTTPDDKALVKGRECGNGVVIVHDGGWETQYCHLRRGSVTVREGESVAAGAALGMVGFSGEAGFAHVHLSVRKDGKNIDPFLGEAFTGACQTGEGLPAASLWAPAIRDTLTYRDGVIIQTGFAADAVTPDLAERGGIATPALDSPALVFFARAINLRAGDRLRFSAEGPGGFMAGNEGEPLPRAQAVYVGFTGKKRKADRWPAGVYEGVAAVIRDGAVVSQSKSVLRMP